MFTLLSFIHIFLFVNVLTGFSLFERDPCPFTKNFLHSISRLPSVYQIDVYRRKPKLSVISVIQIGNNFIGFYCRKIRNTDIKLRIYAIFICFAGALFNIIGIVYYAGIIGMFRKQVAREVGNVILFGGARRGCLANEISYVNAPRGVTTTITLHAVAGGSC